MTEPRLSEYVPVELKRARLERSYEAIAQRLEGRRRGPMAPWLLVSAGALASSALLVGFLTRIGPREEALLARGGSAAGASERVGASSNGLQSDRPPLAESPRAQASGGKLASPGTPNDSAPVVYVAEDVPLSLDVDCGASLELGQHSAATVSQATAATTQVELRRGTLSVTLDGSPAPLRVRAGELLVEGTEGRFVVEVGVAGRVIVAVLRGAVVLRDPSGRSRSLGAGNTVTVERGQSVASGASATSGPARPSETDANIPRRSLPAPSSQEPKKPSTAELIGEGSAKSLWDRATEARRSGRSADAAAAYAELLRRYPADERGGLAAFELGRLRMDRLGDMPGALRALKHAVRSAGGASFAGDARARLVRVYDALGQLDACRKAREDYLQRYPRGLHADSVARGCLGSSPR